MLMALAASSTVRSSTNANLPLVRTFMMGFPSNFEFDSPTSFITAPRNSIMSLPGVPSVILPTKSSRKGFVAGSPTISPLVATGGGATADVNCCHVELPVLGPGKLPGLSILRKEPSYGIPVIFRALVASSRVRKTIKPNLDPALWRHSVMGNSEDVASFVSNIAALRNSLSVSAVAFDGRFPTNNSVKIFCALSSWAPVPAF
mmetsp:Transcript_28593/g.33790  ORF Transcript_28593/g.33790 Transcript_28593/m.33790 type:complete len:203 (-) Transcript_28593:54-662(-)